MKPFDLRIEYAAWRNWRKKLGLILHQMPKPPKPPHPPQPKLPLHGCDYVSGPTPADLHAAGMKFVCRYIAPLGNVYNWKRLGKAEAQALHKAGLDIGLVFESAGQRATSGSAGGASDAVSARNELVRLGAPANTNVFFACDFDVPDYAPKLSNSPSNAIAKLGPIASYFQAIKRSGITTGAYGGYWVIKRLFDAGLIEYGWQAYAWSGGMWDQRALLRQVQNDAKVAGHSVDLDQALAARWGQW